MRATLDLEHAGSDSCHRSGAGGTGAGEGCVPVVRESSGLEFPDDRVVEPPAGDHDVGRRLPDLVETGEQPADGGITPLGSGPAKGGGSTSSVIPAIVSDPLDGMHLQDGVGLEAGGPLGDRPAIVARQQTEELRDPLHRLTGPQPAEDREPVGCHRVADADVVGGEPLDRGRRG